jgi:ATP-dependent helicase/nuclease subunit A
LGIRFVDTENSCYKKTIVQTAVEQKKRRESLAEELRILYVAFTRAMDRLILLGTLKDAEAAIDAYAVKGTGDYSGARAYLDFLIPALEETKIILRRSNRKDISFRKEETEQKRDDVRSMILGGIPEDAAGSQELKLEIQRRLGYQYGHREALQLKSKFTVSELGRMTGSGGETLKASAALDTPKFKREKSAFTAAEKGTILHKVMEQLDFRRPEAVKEVVRDLVDRMILTEEEAAVVSYQKILGFFDSEIGMRASRAEKLYKEVSFNIKKEMFGEKIIIQGTIDCYFEEDGKYILLDYKSNYISNSEDDAEIERIAENYRVQLELYREALEKIRGVKVEETYLYLFSIGKGVRIN